MVPGTKSNVVTTSWPAFPPLPPPPLIPTLPAPPPPIRITVAVTADVAATVKVAAVEEKRITQLGSADVKVDAPPDPVINADGYEDAGVEYVTISPV
jgi:hypothetical protein